MPRFIKNGCLFFLIGLFQIYFEGGSFFIRPIIDFLLIFLIFSFFDFPFFYFVLLLLVRGFIFDTLSGLAWGTNLFSLFFSFGIGFFLTRLLESDNFFSRIIIGESIINLYFLALFLLNLFLSHSNLWLIILIDALINSVVYLVLMMLGRKIRTCLPSVGRTFFLASPR